MPFRTNARHEEQKSHCHCQENIFNNATFLSASIFFSLLFFYPTAKEEKKKSVTSQTLFAATATGLFSLPIFLLLSPLIGIAAVSKTYHGQHSQREGKPKPQTVTGEKEGRGEKVQTCCERVWKREPFFLSLDG